MTSNVAACILAAGLLSLASCAKPKSEHRFNDDSTDLTPSGELALAQSVKAQGSARVDAHQTRRSRSAPPRDTSTTDRVRAWADDIHSKLNPIPSQPRRARSVGSDTSDSDSEGSDIAVAASRIPEVLDERTAMAFMHASRSAEFDDELLAAVGMRAEGRHVHITESILEGRKFQYFAYSADADDSARISVSINDTPLLRSQVAAQGLLRGPLFQGGEEGEATYNGLRFRIGATEGLEGTLGPNEASIPKKMTYKSLMGILKAADFYNSHGLINLSVKPTNFGIRSAASDGSSKGIVVLNPRDVRAVAEIGDEHIGPMAKIPPEFASVPHHEFEATLKRSLRTPGTAQQINNYLAGVAIFESFTGEVYDPTSMDAMKAIFKQTLMDGIAHYEDPWMGHYARTIFGLLEADPKKRLSAAAVTLAIMTTNNGLSNYDRLHLPAPRLDR